MKLTLFRADGSHQLGLGHIRRCLALAQALGERGMKPLFVIRAFDDAVIKLIREAGIGLETIPASSTFDEDAALTLTIAGRGDVSLMVTDLGNSYNLSRLAEYRRYFRALKAADRFMVVLDELIEPDFRSGLQVVPYYGTENINNGSRQGVKRLRGPAYFIFRREFMEAATARRVAQPHAGNILVTMGGSDPANLTPRVSRVLAGMSRKPLRLRIVIGRLFAAPARRELEGILEGCPVDYEIIPDSNDMAGLMLWADMAVIAGGLTKYETAITGTPTIIVSPNDHEGEMSTVFARSGAALHAGQGSQISDAQIAAAVARVLDDEALRDEMMRMGRQMVDGKGISRVIAEIPEEVLS